MKNKNKEVKCSCCGKSFDVRTTGVAGVINGQTIAYCADCCRVED